MGPLSLVRLVGLPLAGLVLLAGCVSVPVGPSVMVLPGYGKPFEVFQAEDHTCRQWAGQQVGITLGDAAAQSAVGSAAIGTILGAGLGAAFGAAAGSPGIGAAVGAGTGLLFGSATGANAAYASTWEMQRRYDIAYQQCMYAKGNQVPGRMSRMPGGYGSPPPPPPPPPPAPALAPPPPPSPPPDPAARPSS
jgi:hypothetical protein